jgi:hypothetical protein
LCPKSLARKRGSAAQQLISSTLISKLTTDDLPPESTNCYSYQSSDTMSSSPQHPVSVKISYWIPEQDKDVGEQPTETRIFDASNVEPARMGLPEHVEAVKVRAANRACYR